MAVAARSMRLLTVSHYFESHCGGVEIVAGRLARSLSEEGILVTWAASDASPPPTDIHVLALRASNLIERRSGLPFPLHGPTSLSQLLGAIRRSDAVLVHDGMYPICIAAIVAARICRRPVVLVQHIGRVSAPSNALRLLFWLVDRCLTRPMLRLASQVVFISATTARHFVSVSTHRSPALIFNGVDSDTFRASVSEDERDSERNRIGWPKDRPTILYVGRFLDKKGLLRLRQLSTLRSDLHWAYAGWGPCDPASWGLANVTVHRGLSGVDLAPLYRAADVLVLPSKSEGFPLVVQEALACGLQPICCDDAAAADPGAADHITSISNYGTEDEIESRYLAAIDTFVSQSEGLDARAKRAVFAQNRYSWNVAAARYASLLHTLVSSREAWERTRAAI